MKAIFNRRSVRKFKTGEITNEVVKQLLQAAMRAPSALNEQPWEFIVIRNRQTLAHVMKIHPYATMLNEADCMILICGNTELQKSPYDFWVQDCSAATQNLLLQATHLGLGSVWLGIYPIEERVIGIQKCFGLPKHVIPLCGVALGYPAVEPKGIDTYCKDKVHIETWSKKQNKE